MSDVTMLRQNAIVRNAVQSAPPPHGPVKTGELPLVQVKQTPGGPQVQEGQQRPVTILPPKDSDSAVKTGGLPMVKVKMTDGKPKKDDGVDEKVVIRDSKHGAVSAGALPMIQVKMTDGKPQIQTLPNVQGGPPQIPAALPALSAPRAAPVAARGGYVARTTSPLANNVRVARVAAPQQAVAAPQPQVALPPVPDMSADQLLFCRHAVEKALADLQAATVAAEPTSPDMTVEAPAVPEAVLAMIKFAESTLATIDDILVATAVRAEAAALAAAQPAPTIAVPASSASAHSVSASASIAPAPTVAYTAGRVAGPFVAGARAQRNSGMAPRRVVRNGAPLPMVQVKMDGQKAVLQNRDEIETAKASLSADAVPPTEIVVESPEVGSGG